MKKTDITAFGEILVDLLPAETDSIGRMCLSVNAGGAPANVAVAAARLGACTAFIGKIGQDVFGDYLRRTLVQNGVDIRGLLSDAQAPTTESLVTLSSSGERSFSFYRNGCADTLIRPGELDPELIAGSKIFHFGSLSLTTEPACSATFRALEIARNGNSLISFDPNYRPTLWSDPKEALARIQPALEAADILKVSEEEAEWITGMPRPEEAAGILLKKGISLVMITLGAKGTWFSDKKNSGTVPASSVHCVDATGAGDSFLGAVLSRLSGYGKNEILAGLDAGILQEVICFGNCAAGLTVSRKGAIPALPTKEELEIFFSSMVNNMKNYTDI